MKNIRATVNRIKDCIFAMLLVLGLLLLLDFTALGGNIYFLVLTLLGVPEHITTYSTLIFAGAFLLAELWLRIKEHRSKSG